MLTTLQVEDRRRPLPPPSLRQQYQEYILQRIEGFKNSLPREELLRIGGEAAEELCAAAGQFVLTEVLMLDTVDRMIRQRLALPSFRKWCRLHRALRLAQREPTHWGIDPRSPVTRLLPRIESGDGAALLGSAAEPYAFLLAAHETNVTFLASDLALVDRVETRAAEESLGYSFTALVASPGHSLPQFEHPVHLAVIDTRALEEFGPVSRREVLGEIQRRTDPGGIHVLIPGDRGLTPEAFVSQYPGWLREEDARNRRRSSSQKSLGVVLINPPRDDREDLASYPHREALPKAL